MSSEKLAIAGKERWDASSTARSREACDVRIGGLSTYSEMKGKNLQEGR